MIDPSKYREKHSIYSNVVFAPFILSLICILFTFIFVISAIYTVYTMLILLSSVATLGGFAFFDESVHKFAASLTIYAFFIVPFLLTYGKNLASLEFFFAMISIITVSTIALMVDDILLESPLVRILQLAKRFLKARKWRYTFSLLSIIFFAAGVTSLSFILPFYALLSFFLLIVCEVAVTMVSNVDERTRELFTLATLGMDPDHCSGLFLAEAFILGFLGGSVGYVVGLFLSLLASLPSASFAVSAGWMLITIIVSVIAAMFSAILPASRASMLATPSLLKRWWREAPQSIGWPPTMTFKLPIRLDKENVEGFFNFLLSYLKMLETLPGDSIERIHEIQAAKPEDARRMPWQVKFKYIYNEARSPMLTTQNELRIVETPNSEELIAEFTVKVEEYENIADLPAYLERIGSTYRAISLEWATKEKPYSLFSKRKKLKTNAPTLSREENLQTNGATQTR